jgi:hypothetical protein
MVATRTKRNLQNCSVPVLINTTSKNGGQRDLSKDVAFNIKEKIPGCTLDWLWMGDYHGLTVGFAQRLDAAEKQSSKTNSSASKWPLRN